MQCLVYALSMQFLYNRIVQGATIAEVDGVPDPQFSLPSTMNWMRALALIVEEEGLDFEAATAFYQEKAIGKGALTEPQQNSAMEQLFFALHQLSALEALKDVPAKADIGRIALICWYYGIYYAASAMLAAKDGSFLDDHTGTAKAWDNQFAEQGLVMQPFHLRVSTLVATEAKEEIRQLRNGNDFSVSRFPTNATEAYGACCSYFSGSVSWYQWKTEEDIRTKLARQLRDSKFEKKTMCFLHQAIRYRGKANYREALFLGYECNFAGFGALNAEALLSDYPDNLYTALAGLLAMAGAFVSRRLGKDLWNTFYDDIEKHRTFSLSASSVWDKR